MSSLPVWIIGFFFIAVIGIAEARYSERARRILEYENEICEPGKGHLDKDGCADCICRSHGYGSVCDTVRCRRTRRRSIDERECTPYSEFTTRCHYCKCSPSGNPIGCVEKRRRCMNDFLEDLDYEIANEDKINDEDMGYTSYGNDRYTNPELDYIPTAYLSS